VTRTFVCFLLAFCLSLLRSAMNFELD
jgi:hypothetical protein